jgi:hypothetical protein
LPRLRPSHACAEVSDAGARLPAHGLASPARDRARSAHAVVALGRAASPVAELARAVVHGCRGRTVPAPSPARPRGRAMAWRARAGERTWLFRRPRPWMAVGRTRPRRYYRARAGA